MADNVNIDPSGSTPIAADDVGGVMFQRMKMTLGDDGVDEGDVSSANPLPVLGPLTDAQLRISPVITADAGTNIWTCSFANSGASVLSSDFVTPIVGTGVTYNQASGNLNILTGTTANAEFFARSQSTFRGAMRLRASIVASQRIANQNLAIMLADVIAQGANFTIVNTTTVDVTKPNHGFTAQNVGQFMHMGGISGAAGVPGRYAIASIPDTNTIRFTVAGWPATGSGTLTLFGWNYFRNLVTGTSATSINWDAQRRGWASGDTTATINSTASPGTIIQNDINGRDAFLMDSVRASATSPTFVSRASRYENLPDEDLDLYLIIWSFNGSTAPASTTTWTLGFISLETFANSSFYLQGVRSNGSVNPLQIQGSVSLTANTPTLAAGTNRAAFIAAAGIWYDDSATTLAANATFTGTARDATFTATAVAFANASTYMQEIRVSAESDVSGTLWLEVSRDNTNWRRVKSVATAAVTGGGQYAEIVHRPSWRYWRVGFTNGATIQARFSIGSVAQAA